MAVTGEVALRAAAARAEAGLPVVTTGLPPPAVRALEIAERLGAPRAPALRAAAAAERERVELDRAVRVAAAEGRSVARGLVLAPPVVGPLTALLVSDAPFAVWSTPTGRVVLGLAVVLWLAGLVVVRALVGAATGPRNAAGGSDDEALELVGIALSAGLGLPPALRLAAGDGGAPDDLRRLALWLELGGQGPPPTAREPWEHIGTVLVGARRDGVPLAPLVRSLAAALRRQAHHEAMQRAARLGARLTLPTTLLLLPAAGLVVAAPVLHGALGALG